MHLIGLVLFAMALGLGALFLLAKAQKDNLGKLFSVSAYVVLTVSVLVILFSISMGILKCCHKNHCGKGSCGKGKVEQCGSSSCEKGEGKSCSSDGKCGATMSCSSDKNSCSMKSGKCSMGSKMNCSKGGDCMMMNPHGGKMFEKKIIKKFEGDSVDVEVQVKTK